MLVGSMDFGVDPHRHVECFVPQELLHCSGVATVLDQVSGERVPQAVKNNSFNKISLGITSFGFNATSFANGDKTAIDVILQRCVACRHKNMLLRKCLLNPFGRLPSPAIPGGPLRGLTLLQEQNLEEDVVDGDAPFLAVFSERRAHDDFLSLIHI